MNGIQNMEFNSNKNYLLPSSLRATGCLGNAIPFLDKWLFQGRWCGKYISWTGKNSGTYSFYRYVGNSQCIILFQTQHISELTLEFQNILFNGMKEGLESLNNVIEKICL